MKVPRHVPPSLFLISLILVLAGCGGQTNTGSVGSTPSKKICYAYQGLASTFWVGALNAVTQGLKTRGYQMVAHDGQQNANTQLQQVKDCINQSVAGIIMVEQDAASAVSIIREANKANVPIAVLNRPPSPSSARSIVVVSDNQTIAEEAVNALVQQAQKLHRKMHPLILVGDLGDPNAILRKKGFDTVIGQYPDLFYPAVYVNTKWDSATGLAGLQDALQAHPDIDFIFTSADFLYPQIKAALQPLGKWEPVGNARHVILGGFDGDENQCALMKASYVDATGVQNLYYEANAAIDALTRAIAAKNTQPNQTITEPPTFSGERTSKVIVLLEMNMQEKRGKRGSLFSFLSGFLLESCRPE
jgi:ABC-type sugar transport system substrate-binding protein